MKKYYKSRNFYWDIILMIGLIWFLAFTMFGLSGCGSDESNVDSQYFIDDFGMSYLYFFNDGCNTSISTSTSNIDGRNIYTVTKSDGSSFNLQGLERNVGPDGIQYTTDNFSLIKYFDDRIVIEYDDVSCQIFTSQIGI